MNRFAPRLALAALALAAPMAASAAEELYSLDPATTTITFTLDTTLHLVHGTAKLSRGILRLDPETGKLGGDVVIDARSLDTDNKGRDEDMHGKVLESAKYPTITLRPERIVGALPAAGARAQVELVGRLEIHGAGHPLRFAATLGREGDRYRLKGAFAVPYIDWGMKDPSKFILSADREVNVTIEALATPAPAPAPPPAPAVTPPGTRR
jgi:polyisoprenoid-binding protein YceI